MHNILSHGARFERSDAGLHGDVASRATVVHVLAERSRELVAPLYDIPADRILHVPHPSYRGAYED